MYNLYGSLEHVFLVNFLASGRMNVVPHPATLTTFLLPGNTLDIKSSAENGLCLI